MSRVERLHKPLALAAVGVVTVGGLLATTVPASAEPDTAPDWHQTGSTAVQATSNLGREDARQFASMIVGMKPKADTNNKVLAAWQDVLDDFQGQYGFGVRGRNAFEDMADLNGTPNNGVTLTVGGAPVCVALATNNVDASFSNGACNAASAALAQSRQADPLTASARLADQYIRAYAASYQISARDNFHPNQGLLDIDGRYGWERWAANSTGWESNYTVQRGTQYTVNSKIRNPNGSASEYTLDSDGRIQLTLNDGSISRCLTYNAATPTQAGSIYSGPCSDLAPRTVAPVPVY